MTGKYVFDACAVAALIYGEPGADTVKSCLRSADLGNAEVYIHKLNLLEVYYDIRRSEGSEQAETFYETVMNLPITIIDHIDDALFHEAGRLKSQYRVSLADSIAVGEASVLNAALLTSDHHELDVIARNEPIAFTWIR